MNLQELAARNTNNRSVIKGGLRGSEGVVDHIYLDSRGILTIGVGSALAVINASNQLVMRPLGEINARFVKAGLNPISDDDLQWLDSINSLPHDQKDANGNTLRDTGLVVLKENFPQIAQVMGNKFADSESLLEFEIDVQLKAIDVVIENRISNLKRTRPNASLANVYSNLTENQVIALVSWDSTRLGS